MADLLEIWMEMLGFSMVLLLLAIALVLRRWRSSNWRKRDRIVLAVLLCGLLAWNVYASVPFAKDFCSGETIETQGQVLEIRQQRSRGITKYFEYTVDDGEGERKLFLLKDRDEVTLLEEGEQYRIAYYRHSGAIISAERTDE